MKSQSILHNKRILLLFAWIVIFSESSDAQEFIQIKNSSFEDKPHKGSNNFSDIRGWFDCSRINYPGESPPDIHRATSNIYNVKHDPQEDQTYLGPVVRENDSYESVSETT